VEELLPCYLQCRRALNPGPMTLEGTNTWIVGDPERAAPVVIDPGPADEQHLQSILTAARGRVAVVVLTHRHADHSGGAARLAALACCDVRAADPDFRTGAQGLSDSDVLTAAGARLVVLATPGHTSDSHSLLVTGEDGVTRLVTGDTVLGGSTSVITHPDGNLGRYLASLELLAAVVADENVHEILPGHGPRVPNPQEWLAYYLRHRQERLAQVREAVAAGDRTPAEVVARVYAEVDPSLWPAAEQSVAAQLEYLAAGKAP